MKHIGIELTGQLAGDGRNSGARSTINTAIDSVFDKGNTFIFVVFTIIVAMFIFYTSAKLSATYSTMEVKTESKVPVILAFGDSLTEGK